MLALPANDRKDAMYEDDYYAEYEEDEDRIEFANPGSALRASSKSNPRNLPCPTCGAKNVLTPADRARGYQCDRCADRDEGLSFPY